MTPIYFFNGWGMDASAISHLSGGRITIISAHPDARIPIPDAAPAVIAWSFGVRKANQWLNSYRGDIAAAIAINGTPQAVHDHLGIPPAAALAALHGLTDASREKLYRRIFGREFKKRPARSTAEQAAELQAIIHNAADTAVSPYWQTAWISRLDPIFPQDNQLNAWRQTAASIRRLDAPHHLLSCFSSWQAFLDASR